MPNSQIVGVTLTVGDAQQKAALVPAEGTAHRLKSEVAQPLPGVSLKFRNCLLFLLDNEPHAENSTYTV